MKAVDSAGATVDSTGEDNWGFDANPRQFSVKGAGIVQIEIDVDNHWNGTTFATYSSLPIAEIRWMLDQRRSQASPERPLVNTHPGQPAAGNTRRRRAKPTRRKSFASPGTRTTQATATCEFRGRRLATRRRPSLISSRKIRSARLQLGNVPAFTAKLEGEAWVIRGPEFDKFLADFFRAGR